MIRFLFLLALLFSINLANAAEKVFRFGLMPTISNFTVIDPYGPTAPGNSFSLMNVVAFMDIGRDSRLMGNIGYDQFNIGATQTNIAQDVKRTGGGMAYQSMFRISRDFKPWLGFGVGVASEKYQNRYTLSPGGFSIPANPAERSVNNIYGFLNLSNEWQIGSDFTMGLHLQFEQPSGDGTKVLRLGIYAVY